MKVFRDSGGVGLLQGHSSNQIRGPMGAVRRLKRNNEGIIVG